MYPINTKRLIITMLTTFVAVWATDFLIHGVLIRPDYAASLELWRPESDMGKYFPWMLSGQLLAAVAIVMLYAKGFANGCLKTACIFGLITGGASQSLSLIFYAVMPIPGMIITKWVFFGLIQGVTLGVVAWAVYKRKPDPVDASSR